MSSKRHFATVTALTLSAALAIQVPTAAQCVGDGWGHLPRWIPPGTGPGHQVGRTVSIDGTTAVVGAPGGDAVHVYQRTGSTWSFLQTLNDPYGSGNGFAESLELDGDLLAVGAPQDSTDGPQSGVAHVYERVGGVWSYVTLLQDPTPTDGGDFGRAVGVSGNWVAVGAPDDKVGGGVQIYYRDPAGFQFVHELSLGISDEFGWALAVKDNPAGGYLELFVGDWGNDWVATDAGAVVAYYVFPGQVVPGQIVFPGGASGGEYFGEDLACDGDRLVVGAYGDDDNGSNAGAAYVLKVDGSLGLPLLDFEKKLLGCNTNSSDNFGRSVDIDGSRVAVGAPNDEFAFDQGGRVHVFELNPFGTDWVLEDSVDSEDGVLDDDFGWEVALDGDALLVGARGVDEAGSQGGAAYYVSLSTHVFPGGELPSPHLATVTEYGSGKPGTLGTPTLTTTDLPLPDELHVLRLQGGLPGALPFMIWGLVPAAIPFDGGTLFVGDPRVLTMTPISASGISPFAWTPPSAPALLGVDVYMQAMFFDPLASGALKTAQTNGLQLTIGY